MIFRKTRSLFDYVRNVLTRSIGAKRYEFQREQAGVWTLCFDPTLDPWQVEQVGTGGELLRFSISAFEATNDAVSCAPFIVASVVPSRNAKVLDLD